MCIHEIKGNLYNYQHVREGKKVKSIYMGPVSGNKPWIKQEPGEMRSGYSSGGTSKKVHEPPLKVDKVTLQELKEADIKERQKMVNDISKVKPVKMPDDSVETYFNGSGEIVGKTYTDEDGRVYDLPSVAPVKQRERIYTKASMRHPAKMYTPLVQRIIQDYSEPGDTILDPMGGIGTTGIEASRLGRNAIVNEYEKRFVNEAKKNKILLEKSGQKIGDDKIIHGDARELKVNKKADLVITSPPFADVVAPSGEHFHNEKYKDTGLYDTKATKTKEYQKSIGGMKGEEFNEETKKVYSECHRVLKPKGNMVVHMKNYIKNEKIVRLDTETIETAESTGFKFVERKRRKITNPTFFVRAYRKKHPDTPKVNYEDVLVFKKV